MSKKERNGKQHFRHACRCFEPSEEELKIEKFINYRLQGCNKTESCKKSGVSTRAASEYILPEKELWESLPKNGRGSKYTYIKNMQRFASAKRYKGNIEAIMLCLIDGYVRRDYEELKRKADKYDAIMTLIK